MVDLPHLTRAGVGHPRHIGQSSRRPAAETCDISAGVRASARAATGPRDPVDGEGLAGDGRARAAGVPASKGGFGAYSATSWAVLHRPHAQRRARTRAKSSPCRDARGRDPVAVDHHTRASTGVAPSRGRTVSRTPPVRGGPVAVQQAGGPEEEGEPVADARDPARAARTIPQEIQHRAPAHLGGRAVSPRARTTRLRSAGQPWKSVVATWLSPCRSAPARASRRRSAGSRGPGPPSRSCGPTRSRAVMPG